MEKAVFYRVNIKFELIEFTKFVEKYWWQNNSIISWKIYFSIIQRVVIRQKLLGCRNNRIIRANFIVRHQISGKIINFIEIADLKNKFIKRGFFSVFFIFTLTRRRYCRLWVSVALLNWLSVMRRATAITFSFVTLYKKSVQIVCKKGDRKKSTNSINKWQKWSIGINQLGTLIIYFFVELIRERVTFFFLAMAIEWLKVIFANDYKWENKWRNEIFEFCKKFW